MKLLILTQKVDRDDDLLGFFHGWLEKLAGRYEKITVICLERGRHTLPRNVKVLSLGKEEFRRYPRFSRLIYRLVVVLRFYDHIIRKRRNYGKVLVHMNKEYIVLGGWLWRLWGKESALWYNHKKGNFWSRLAGRLADKIFYTSPFSFFAGWAKARMMPAGINTDLFRRRENIPVKTNSLLYLGRISPVKNVGLLIEAMRKLERDGYDFVLNIVGEAGTRDKEYLAKIKKSAQDLGKKGRVVFSGKVPNPNTPDIYNRAEIFINLTDSGSLDKTTLEAMACENLVLVSNRSYEKIFPAEWHDLMIFREGDADDLAKKLIGLLELSREQKNEIGKRSRAIVVREHSLDILVNKIVNELR